MGWTYSKAACAVAAVALTLSACSDERVADYDADPQAPRVAAAPAPSQPDDTGRNTRDRDGTTLTPGDQSNTAPDLALTQRIRQGITANEAMSMEARNVKVITQDGVVTLRGPVETQAEKTTIEGLARSAGASRIDNQLEVDGD